MKTLSSPERAGGGIAVDAAAWIDRLFDPGRRSRTRALDHLPCYDPYVVHARGLIARMQADPAHALVVVRMVASLVRTLREREREWERQAVDYESRLAALRLDSEELDRMRAGTENTGSCSGPNVEPSHR